MPTKKKPVKPAAKKAAKTAKPAPKKPAAKPSPKKVAKPAAKKVVKAAPAKAVKPAPKKPVKHVAKPAVKKAAPAKPQKPIAKKVVKPAATVVKPAVKTVVAKKPVIAAKPQPAAKPQAIVPTPQPAPAIKAPVKKAIQELKKESKAKPVEIKPVKTTVSTSIKYQPDFTKSVLDKKPVVKEEGPMVRYSDAELQEFKDLIQRKLEAAKKELVFLQGLITRKDDSGGDDGDGRYMTMEDGSVSMEREQLNQRASRQITYINHLEKALMRIENKTYGVCRVTGKLIDKARLRAVPHATLSMEAKTGQVRTSGE
jgi:RNA polymerase-binding transcription factor DksA